MSTSEKQKTGIKLHLLKILLASAFVLGLTIFVNSTDVQAATKSTGLKQGYISGLSETTGVGVGYTTGAADYMYYRVGTSASNVTSAREKLYIYAHAYAEDNENPYMAITGLSAGKTYYVQIGSASEGDQNITWSDPLEVVTAPNAAPTNLKHIKSEKKSITVSWSTVSGANIYAVNTLKYGSQNWSSDKTVTTNKIRLTGLSQGSAYGVRVYAGRKSSAGYIAYGRGVSATKYYPTTSKKPGTPYLTSGYEQRGSVSARIKTPQSHVSGYQFQIYDMGTKKVVATKTTSGTYSAKITAKSTRLKKNNLYKIRVRGYVKDSNNKKYYGDWSSYSYFASQKDGTFSAKRAINGEKISWKSVKGAKRYAIWMSTSLNGKYTKVKTVKGKSYTIKTYKGKALKSGKRYYVIVAPEVKDGKAWKSTKSNMRYSWSFVYR